MTRTGVGPGAGGLWGPFYLLLMKTLLVLSLAIAATAHAQPTQLWTQGNPSAEEQQALEWLNAARKDPVGTLSQVLNLGGSDPVVTGFLLAENPVTAAQLEQQLSNAYQAAVANSAQFPSSAAISNAPLALYPLFEAQAQYWGLASPPATDFPAQRPPPTYIYPTPFFGEQLLNGPSDVFTGPNATGGTAQFGPFGANYAEVSQANLYASYITGREWVLSLLTSQGTGSPPPSFLVQGDTIPGLTLGHTRMAGLVITPGQSGNQILTWFRGSDEFLTQSDLPFGTANTVFITGVAYQDNNSNGVYDPGEGIGGVTVTPNNGNWYAVTSTSGGYAIPVHANSGTYTLTATGGPFHGATMTVTVGSDNVKADWVLPAAAAALPVQVPVAAPDGTTQLVGLSTRGLVQNDANVLIGGFVISGPAGGQKEVLIRGVGPSLQTAGFPANECIPATSIEVFSGMNVIASNTGWTTSPDGGAAVIAAGAQVGEFPLTNWAGGGGDSALVTTLAPGAYTVVVSPAPGLPAVYQTGRVGLVEIYDVTPSDGSRFVNISTRGLLGSGDDQLIVGCTVAGSGHKRLLIRGIGPGLTSYGVPGVLPNPTLTLYDSTSTAIAFNDDWSDSAQTSQIRELAQETGAFQLAEGSVDSALIALELPGNYTAIVGAKPGTQESGVALVELYDAP